MATPGGPLRVSYLAMCKIIRYVWQTVATLCPAGHDNIGLSNLQTVSLSVHSAVDSLCVTPAYLLLRVHMC